MAFQSAPMIDGTVYDNLNLPKAIFGEVLDRGKAEELLGKVDLENLSLDKSIKTLSGGERSRVAIARTLVNKLDVLLLDEITASLDYRTMKEIERLILKLMLYQLLILFLILTTATISAVMVGYLAYPRLFNQKLQFIGLTYEKEKTT